MRWLPVVVIAAAALAGCGSEPRLSASAAEALHSNVDAVRNAVRDGDRDRALRALERLSARVERAELSEAHAAALERGIAQSRQAVEQELAAPEPELEPEPTPEPTAEPVPTAEPLPEEGGKKEKGPKPGKGRGRDESDEEFEDDGEGDD